MENQYAKEYYDTHLQSLEEDYKTARWFSSPAAKLDYDQTRRTLVAVLEGVQVEQTLEIGPGDGVWTDLVLPRTNSLTLLDQSIEMIKRAKQRLHNESKVTFVHSDFQAFATTETFDLIFAIRCFEYFDDKELAAEKFATLLNTGGMMIVVTKNPEHIKMSEVHKKELHTGQISQNDMKALMKRHGLEVTKVLSSTWRFKARFLPTRLVFNALQWLHVVSGGVFKIPFVTNSLTESYTYVIKKH